MAKRLRLSEILARELEVVQLGSRIQSQVQSEMEKGQREYFLREQLKAIQQELGEGDERQAEIKEPGSGSRRRSFPSTPRRPSASCRALERLRRPPPSTG